MLSLRPSCLIILAAGLSLASGSQAERVVAERPLMGTTFRVIVETENTKRLQAATDAAFAKAALIEAVCSDYREESEVSAVARLKSGDSLIISPMFADVMNQALRLSAATDGAYNPALGTMTRLWRNSVKTRQLPTDADINQALAASNITDLKLSNKENPPSIQVSRPGIRIDLGGIAKGYAADAMHDVLKEAGFDRCVIIAGGDVRVGAPPTGESGWKIGLRTLSQDIDDTIITLANAAVSTSGGLYQTVKIDGVNYSHILDPSTGLGLTEPIAASVIAKSATLSDALATAACVAGPERATKEIEAWGGTAVRVVTEENGKPQVAASDHFE